MLVFLRKLLRISNTKGNEHTTNTLPGLSLMFATPCIQKGWTTQRQRQQAAHNLFGAISECDRTFRVLKPDLTMRERGQGDYAVRVRGTVARITMQLGLAVATKRDGSEVMRWGDLLDIGRENFGTRRIKSGGAAQPADTTVYKSA